MRSGCFLLLLFFLFVASGCSYSGEARPAGNSILSDGAQPEEAVQNSLEEILNVFPFTETGRYEIPSQEQVCPIRQALSSFQKGDVVSPQMRGAIIIDGTLIGVQPRSEKALTLKVRITSVLLGDISSAVHEVEIVMPNEANGGIKTLKGRPYRFFVLPINGTYYSWAGAGSYPKGRGQSDRYKCPKVADVQRQAPLH